MLLWDIFKAYILGVFISLKAYINKKWQKVELLKDSANLETQYKVSGAEEIRCELDMKLSKLRLIEAPNAAKSIMYARQ